MEITKKTQKIVIGHAPSHYASNPSKDVVREELTLKGHYGGSVDEGKYHYLVLRPKSNELAENSATICEYCCDELNNIFYSQKAHIDATTGKKFGGRYSLWNYLTSDNNTYKITSDDTIEEIIYKLSKVKDTDETLYVDCSSFVATCAKIGGAWTKLSDLPTTASAADEYKKSGLYDAFDTEQYRKSLDYLKRGDILIARTKQGCKYNHATMVLGNGELAPLNLDFSSSFYIKPNIKINVINVSSNSVTIKVDTDKTAEFLDLYDWKFLSTSQSTSSSLKQEVLFGKENTLVNLTPNTLYFLKLLGENKNNSREIVGTANVLFKTELERPSSVNDLIIRQFSKEMPVEKLYINFKAPKTWPNAAEEKFYRIYLVVNGNVVGVIDKDTAGSTDMSEILPLQGLAIDPNSQIQIGVRAGYNKKNPVFDTEIPKWSNIIIVKTDLKPIERIFIKLKKVFLRAILYIKVKKR